MPPGGGAATLFDLSPRRPTTRQVADLIREGRAGDRSLAPALPAAVRRADDARYQEVTCRSALNRVRGMPFEWTLNPYRGSHGCHYCFARRYHPHLELDAGDEFASVILVKVTSRTCCGGSSAGRGAASSSDSAPPPIRINRSRAATGSAGACSKPWSRTPRRSA